MRKHCSEQSGPTHEIFYPSLNLCESFMMYTYVEPSNFSNEMLPINNSYFCTMEVGCFQKYYLNANNISLYILLTTNK